MASASAKRYSKPPKIETKKAAGDKDKNEAGRPEAAAAAAKSSAGKEIVDKEKAEGKGGSEPGTSLKGVKQGESTPHDRPGGGAEPERSELSGTTGIPLHEAHAREMKEMHGRHHKEMEDMHARHAEEHKKMAKRHGEDVAAHTGGHEQK